MVLMIVSGRSGSGKSVALRALEDMGFYCVDNLPVVLLPDLARTLADREISAAVSIDVRNMPESPEIFEQAMSNLPDAFSPQLLFLDADRNTLIRRYSDTRRLHPLSSKNLSLESAIDKESELLEPLRSRADLIVDTSEMSVHELAEMLRNAGINNCYLEGEMVQGKRNEAIKRLTEGRVNVLVATDVAARGIDIPDVSHVFNFDMPRSGDTYLHRIGRTGRAGRKGTAISLVEAHDHLLLGKASRYIDEPLKARVIDELRPTTRAPSEKSNGKPSKKVLAKRAEKKAKEKEKPRVKKRHRDAKNIGKRRKPSGAATQQSDKE